jgi:hypothetical protein
MSASISGAVARDDICIKIFYCYIISALCLRYSHCLFRLMSLYVFSYCLDENRGSVWPVFPYRKTTQKIQRSRRSQPRVIPPPNSLPAKEPTLEAPSALDAMAEKTLHDFSIPSASNVDTRPNINAWMWTLNWSQASSTWSRLSPFSGTLDEDTNAHLQNLWSFARL